MSTKWKRALIMGCCVSLGSQVSISILTDGFIIAMAVVVLGLMMYEYNTLSPIVSGIIVGIMSPAFRGILLFLRSGISDPSDRLHWVLRVIYPECGFYFTYGLCFALLYLNNRRKKTSGNYFFCLMLCDFCSNMVEMFLRNGGHIAGSSDISYLALIAVCRSAVITCILVGMSVYRSLLTRKEHEERYKKLLIMVAVFRSEIYFMSKNMVEIEDVMKKAFTMYRTMEKENYPEDIRLLSLDVAKDVHEIKKDYIRVIKGLQDNFLADIQAGAMRIKDLLNILEVDIREQIAERGEDITFSWSARTNFVVADHFSLMAVLRNLVINSLDALSGEKNGRITLRVEADDEDQYVFTVSDNGHGIKEEDLQTIFDPGYSTKFDDETGDINRGVGLTLVRDLVRDKFGGEVGVESKEGRYTDFQITIPVENMQEAEHEVLHS